MQNLDRFYTTSDFDREYLRNETRYQKSERHVISSDSSRVQLNKSGELWSIIRKVVHVSLDPPKSTFSTDYISALMGCWLLKFLQALEFDQAMVAQITIGVGGPLKNFKGQHLKLCLKFYICASNFGGSGHILTKFYHRMCLVAGVITWTLILQGVPPTKFGMVKNVENSARFLTTFEFDRIYLRNGSTYRKSEKYFIPYWAKKFGECWSTNNKVIDPHIDPPNWTFFGRLYFGP